MADMGDLVAKVSNYPTQLLLKVTSFPWGNCFCVGEGEGARHFSDVRAQVGQPHDR